MGNFAFKSLEVFATDIDISNQFESIIKNGIYPYEQLQRIPAHLFEKYFTKVDAENYVIDKKLNDRIRYIKSDLTKLVSPGNEFSLILCKNVLLHLEQKQRIDVIRMFHESLGVGGLFATEQTQKLPDEVANLFEPVYTNAQIFRKK
jgi:chemotaxis protein methyltransferase CheR